jgi:hypothetical protein
VAEGEAASKNVERNLKNGYEVESMLTEELERLQAKLGLSLGLNVVWIPSVDKGLSGEVRNGTIYVYEAEEDKALQALRHELVDHLITSRIVKPLVELVNLLIKSRESEIYEEKERLVEMLSKLLV